MAEWTGRKRTLNSLEYDDPPPANAAPSDRAAAPEAPGAIASPQIPGQTPDRPSVPGYERGELPPPASTLRPLTEYGSAQRMLRLFTPPPGTELVPSDWEQGPASFEELRKLDPALNTPERPLRGYGLGLGRQALALAAAMPEALAAETAAELAATAEPAGIVAPVETAAQGDVPMGAIAGDGTVNCPPEFPVKGNAQSMIDHAPESRVYGQTIPEFCFATAEAAEAAGFRATRQH